MPDNAQLATPTSLAESYDDDSTILDSEQSLNFQNQADFRTTLLPEKTRLLTECHRSRDTSFNSDLRPEDDEHMDDVFSTESEYVAAEEDLSVWGYMISTSSESLSFLLSKESRCGLKNSQWRNAKESDINSGTGVILTDYNGDNMASSGYLIGRHKECDVIIHRDGVCERHCVIFKIQTAQQEGESEVRHHVYLQDISGKGTNINAKLVQRNEVRQLHDNDIVALSPNGPAWTYKMTHRVLHKSFGERFRIGKTLGKGHFAEVFEVFDRTTGTRYAAKMIKKRSSSDAKTFLHEIGLLMSCTHPLITCIRDVFDAGKVIYLVLELAAGGELFDRIIQRGKFTEDETRYIFRQVFSALQYLHVHSIVHRDIKPENILLTSATGLDIRIADFGLAKIIGDSTSTSTLAGTPSYIPPEMLAPTQTAGQALPYTNKVDSWSAGVVLYICLCGFPPFSSELAPPPMKTQIREGRYQFTRPYWDTISDSAMDLVRCLMTVDVAERYTVEQALAHPWMHDSQPKVPIPVGEPRLNRGIKRQRTMMQDLGRVHK